MKILLLVLGIGGLGWYFGVERHECTVALDAQSAVTMRGRFSEAACTLWIADVGGERIALAHMVVACERSSKDITYIVRADTAQAEAAVAVCRSLVLAGAR